MKNYILELALFLFALLAYVVEIIFHGSKHIVASTIVFLITTLALLACARVARWQNKQKNNQQKFDAAVADIKKRQRERDIFY